MIVKLEHQNGQVQRLACADLCTDGVEVYRSLGSSSVTVVYSDPPWNPGNEKWWRRHAGLEPPDRYDRFLNAWCDCASSCNTTDIFCEQSVNDKHRGMLLDAIQRCSTWTLPLVEEWTILYGNPRRPNKLLHFGKTKLGVDPSGMHGDSIVSCIFQALPKHTVVADPCMGLGTTSRQAHKYGFNCIGTELNQKRLQRTIDWLIQHNYKVS